MWILLKLGVIWKFRCRIWYFLIHYMIDIAFVSLLWLIVEFRLGIIDYRHNCITCFDLYWFLQCAWSHPFLRSCLLRRYVFVLTVGKFLWIISGLDSMISLSLPYHTVISMLLTLEQSEWNVQCLDNLAISGQTSLFHQRKNQGENEENDKDLSWRQWCEEA